MSRFCGKCGSKIDEITNLCPICDSEKIEESHKTVIESYPEYRAQTNKVTEFDDKKQTKEVQDTRKEIDDSSENLTRKEKKYKKKVEKFTRKLEKKAGRTLGQKIKLGLIKFFVILLVIALLIGSIVATLVYFDIVDIPIINDILVAVNVKNYEETDFNQSTDGDDLTEGNDLKETSEVNNIDADSYYSDNSEIVSEVSAKDSDNVTTESQTISLFDDRGFNESSIKTEYSMDGEYSEPSEISDSSEKHPIYQSVYLTDNGDVWNIFVINGKVMANPVSYNLQSKLETQLIISESKSVTSYDSDTNKFFETIPDESSLIVKKVDKINSVTLEKLTIEEIDKL